MIRSAKLD